MFGEVTLTLLIISCRHVWFVVCSVLQFLSNAVIVAVSIFRCVSGQNCAIYYFTTLLKIIYRFVFLLIICTEYTLAKNHLVNAFLVIMCSDVLFLICCRWTRSITWRRYFWKSCRL